MACSSSSLGGVPVTLITIPFHERSGTHDQLRRFPFQRDAGTGERGWHVACGVFLAIMNLLLASTNVLRDLAR